MGIKIGKDPSSLYHLNYPPVISKVGQLVRPPILFFMVGATYLKWSASQNSYTPSQSQLFPFFYDTKIFSNSKKP